MSDDQLLAKELVVLLRASVVINLFELLACVEALDEWNLWFGP